MSNFFYSSVWTTNGGPIPQSVTDALEKAIEAVLKGVEEKDGLRLLYTSKRTEKQPEVL
jgi:hypothetical protein